MPKQLNLIDSPLKDIDLGFSLEEELEFNLELARFKFDQDRSTALAAFQALNYLVGYWWQRGKQPLEDTVPLPWWAAEVLAEGYLRYQETVSSVAPKTLGETFGMEGGGQGKERRIKADVRELRDIRIAIKLSMLLEDGVPKQAALQRLATEADLSADRIEKIWDNKSKKAREVLSNFRNRRNLVK